MPDKEELRPYTDQLDVAAERYQVSTRTIRRWMMKHGIYNPRMGYGPGKLDPAKALEIRRLYRTDKFTQYELAVMFGVTQAMICRIINNKAYHIDLILGGVAKTRKLSAAAATMPLVAKISATRSTDNQMIIGDRFYS